VAHVFDTNLAAPQRTLVMDGVVRLLAGLLIANGGYLANVVPFGAVVRSWTDVDGVELLRKSLLGQTPAIAVALGGRSSKPKGTGGFVNEAELELLVYFASNNMGDLAIGRQMIDAAGVLANTNDPGLHVMLEHAEELIVGQRCGASTTIKQVRADREEELHTSDDLTLWLQTYQITLVRTINQYRDVTQLLTSLRFRTIQEVGEVNLPNAPTKGSTIDANRDGL
jgi:hypothetical protein